MTETEAKPSPELKPEGEEAHALAQKMTSEPMIVVIALAIFLFCVVVFEWKTILDGIVTLFPGLTTLAAWLTALVE